MFRLTAGAAYIRACGKVKYLWKVRYIGEW